MITEIKDYTFFESFKRIFLWVPEVKKDFMILIVREIIVQIFGIISLIYLSQLIVIFQSGTLEKLESFLIGYLVLAFVHLIVRWYTTPWGHSTLKHSIENIVTTKVVRKFLIASRDDIERLGVGKCISIIMRDTNQHVWIGLRLIVQLCSLSVSIGLGTYLLIQLHTSILILPLLGIIIMIGYSTYKSKISTHGDQEALWSLFKEYDRTVARQIMSQSEILQNNTIEQEISLLKKNANQYARIYIKGSYRFTKNYSFAYFLLILLYVGVAYFLAKTGHIHNPSSLPFLAGIFGFIAFFHTQMMNFVIFFEEFIVSYMQVKSGWKLFDSIRPMIGYSTGSPFVPHPSLPIAINHITYGYNDTKVFSDFSLTLSSGKKTALVGASGGGKTTLIKLIAGYLHPDIGSISVLGNTLSETALKTYYPHIGYLTQDPGVFDATIRENLLSALPQETREETIETEAEKERNISERGAKTGMEEDITGTKIGMETETKTKTKQENHPFLKNTNNRDNTLDQGNTLNEIIGATTDEKLLSALRLAQCDFVFEMEKGLDTEIGERGVRLSGGQKQRLAIAKIFLKDPKIILLDEPTSALDSFSEEKITEALNILFEGRTVIIVAHRLQTVKNADEIIVIEGGQVAERGTHTELITHGGIYAKMLELQSGF